MSLQLEPDAFDEIIEAFKKLDQNNDGLTNSKDVYYSYMSFMSDANDNDIEISGPFLKFLSLTDELDTKEAPAPISIVDFFIFLTRNLVDYEDSRITYSLYHNLIPKRSRGLTKDRVKELLEDQGIKCTDQEFEEMIKFAEFDENGNLNHRGFSKLMQKLATFPNNESNA